MKEQERLPPWLRLALPHPSEILPTKEILKKREINTVCEEANCPNRIECYCQKKATFLALGKTCTRSCAFCNVAHDKNPPPPDPKEPLQIACAVKELHLKHVVVTMVTRDDLPDGGASHIASIIDEIRSLTPQVTIEVLTSDFGGNFASLDLVLEKKPTIFNHNMETVQRLTGKIRHKANYHKSLSILKYAKDSGFCLFVKSGLMVGLGETKEEVFETLHDLRPHCDIVTIGQYLQASPKKIKVKEFIPPLVFQEYEAYAHSIGIKKCFAAPLVRSSYHAEEIKKATIPS